MGVGGGEEKTLLLHGPLKGGGQLHLISIFVCKVYEKSLLPKKVGGQAPPGPPNATCLIGDARGIQGVEGLTVAHRRCVQGRTGEDRVYRGSVPWHTGYVQR